MIGAFVINIIAGTILTILQKVLPAEIWIFLIILPFINYILIFFFKSRKKSFIILIILLVILNTILLWSMYYMINKKSNSLPLTSSYWVWKQTDIISGNDSSLLPVKHFDKNIIELNLDRPEQIAEKEVYYNIGYIHKISDTHWLLEVRYSDQFYDFTKGTIRVILEKKYFPNNDKLYVYLTNKPKMNTWISVSNYHKPYFREIGLF